MLVAATEMVEVEVIVVVTEELAIVLQWLRTKALSDRARLADRIVLLAPCGTGVIYIAMKGTKLTCHKALML